MRRFFEQLIFFVTEPWVWVASLFGLIIASHYGWSIAPFYAVAFLLPVLGGIVLLIIGALAGIIGQIFR